jgi:hypothetical protein
MRMLIAAIALGLLAGCMSSNVNQAQSAGPYKTFVSQKPAQIVAECVEFTWQDEKLFGNVAEAWLHKDNKGGFRVYTRDSEHFVDVIDATGGAQVSYYVVTRDAMAQRRLSVVATCL